jgi:hypothetical protein
LVRAVGVVLEPESVYRCLCRLDVRPRIDVVEQLPLQGLVEEIKPQGA